MEVYSTKSQGIEGFVKPKSPSTFSQQGRVQGHTEPQSKKVADDVKKDQNQMLKAGKETYSGHRNYPKMVEIAQKVREKLESINVNIQFEVNRELGRIIIKVIDPASGEVVRKIPPEKFMRSVEFLNEMKNELHVEGIEVDVKY
jgi:flagellar protein FlaG